MRDPDDFPARPWRRRLLILVLALATAGTVLVSVLKSPQGVPRPLHPPTLPMPDAAPCGAGQTRACVGGMAGVIVAPSAATSAASR